MPKRRSAASESRAPLILGLLAGLALVVFLGGELYAYLNSDTGRLALYRRLHFGDRAHITRIVGKHLHEGLRAARIPESALQEQAEGGDGPALKWTVTLPRDGAPMQVNYALTHALEQVGAAVLSGHEAPGTDGALHVTLTAGLPGMATHEIVVTRPGRPREEEAKREARIAIVLQGIGDDAAASHSVLGIAAPLAVMVPAIGDGHEKMLREAHDTHYEVVLLVPMEPENYPRVDPGAGTLLVNMPAHRVEGDVKKFVKQAGDVAAVANLYGSFATQDEPFMTAVYNAIKDLGLTFLHLSPVPRAVCKPLASQMGVAYDEPDFMLVDEARAKKPEALVRSWKAALEHAQKRGSAIVVLRVTPLSAKWLPGAITEKGLEGAQLVPLSAVIHHPTAR